MIFTPGTVKFFCLEGGCLIQKATDGFISGPFGVHQTQYEDGAKMPGAWTVTHLASGRQITQDAASRAHAERFCADIIDLMDWETVVPLAPLSPEKLAVLQKALDRAWGHAGVTA